MNTEDKRLKNLRAPWRPGESGNARGRRRGGPTLRARLKRLDEDAFAWLKRLFQSSQVDDTALEVLRLFFSLRFPEQWRARELAAGARTQGQPSQPFLSRPELSQEDRRAVIEFLAQHLKPKEVLSGANQPQIAGGETETGQPLKE